MVTGSKDYEFQEIERRWQSFWEREHSFRAGTHPDRPKYYALDMFPYPSGTGLHIGHPEGYTGTDILSRYKRAKGFDVLHPLGWDAFGLPAEQHAVKTGAHPATNTQNNIANFRRQIKALGFSYDWEREVDTTDPRYFRWTQWIFLQLFRRGLAYVDERPVWWCPEMRTVLANEEIVDGRSEVGGFPVERRNLRQWVLRITAYADRLLSGLDGVDWPDSTKRMQAAWIGRSEGAEITFGLEKAGPGGLKIFTTRPDTLFGCTYMVLAPEHALVDALTSRENRVAVDEYRRKAASKSDLERTDLAKDKSGVFTGSFAVNPVNGSRVPVWVADYVLMGYGTGAIMAVPAHDERDYEFATRYKLPVVPVIEAADHSHNGHEPKLPYTGDGNLVHSDGYTGLPWREAKLKITADLAARGAARPLVNYKLRDWLFSRQRYWGEPIPIVWVSGGDYRRAASRLGAQLPAEPVSFEQDGAVRFALPLPESALPLELPPVESYLPSGNGESALANVTDWVDVWYDYATGMAHPASAPRPAGDTWVRARRETNTMPQWAGSCWYYLRFTDPWNDRAFASPEALARWGGPDLYVGGAEHAVLHLLYARFWHKVLFDMGAVPTDEPFKRLFHQGIILGEDGEKMAKSGTNAVSPDTIIQSHGADTLRLYLMFLGPLEAMKPWNTKGIEGVHRFLQKVWHDCVGEDGGTNPRVSEGAVDPPAIQRLLHETIRKVGDDIEALRFNTAISQMMILENALHKEAAVSRAATLAFIQVLAPFAPHFAEEVWSRLGAPGTAAGAPWPAFDPAKLTAAEFRLVFQVNGKHRADQLVPVGVSQDEAVAIAMAHEKVAPFLAGKKIVKVFYVPGRILNLVAIEIVELPGSSP
jgi:leucyl-tRNA synthetase